MLKKLLTRTRGLLAAAVVLLAGVSATSAPAQTTTAWGRDYFPNVVLTDHNGRQLRFYDDIIRGKIVVINFIYTSCGDICPLDTAQLRRVQEILGDRVGRDIHMYTISLDPARDRPEQLRQFMRTYDVRPGWTFLTGSVADVELLQRRLGVRAADPNNLSEHDTSILFGNEPTGQWIRRTAYENPQIMADLLSRRLQNFAAPVTAAQQDYAGAGRVADNSHGAYIFRTRCQSCHTIGGGDRLGPDLRGVSTSRPAAWLTRWIKEPNLVIAERDPTALAMVARYRNLPMPNLGLNDAEVAAVVEYLRAQDTQATQAAQRR